MIVYHNGNMIQRTAYTDAGSEEYQKLTGEPRCLVSCVSGFRISGWEASAALVPQTANERVERNMKSECILSERNDL